MVDRTSLSGQIESYLNKWTAFEFVGNTLRDVGIDPQVDDLIWGDVGKFIAAEAALLVITPIVLIETVVYSALALISLTLYPLTDAPYAFFASLLKNTPGVFVRIVKIICFPIVIITGTLGASLYSFESIRSLSTPEEKQEEIIKKGAAFIAIRIFGSADNKLLEQYKQLDDSLTLFLQTQALFIYAFGKKKTRPLPPFFSAHTNAFITKLRQMTPRKAIISELTQVLESPETFLAGPQSGDVRNVFNKIKKHARQLCTGAKSCPQDNPFLVHCLPRAMSYTREKD